MESVKGGYEYEADKSLKGQIKKWERKFGTLIELKRNFPDYDDYGLRCELKV